MYFQGLSFIFLEDPPELDHLMVIGGFLLKYYVLLLLLLLLLLLFIVVSSVKTLKTNTTTIYLSVIS